jgi:hypothetical protein
MGSDVINRQDHLHTVSRTRPQERQQGDLRKIHQITYSLRVEQAARASTAGLAEDAPDHVLAEGGTRPQDRQKRDLQKMH